jgi:hypothetical protein
LENTEQANVHGGRDVADFFAKRYHGPKAIDRHVFNWLDRWQPGTPAPADALPHIGKKGLFPMF